ncbi:MAG: hypothetical protein H7249_11290 [Chitinophagaceae bacterium]|nr:hypothetical protein [Oligoflexus sp.]
MKSFWLVVGLLAATGCTHSPTNSAAANPSAGVSDHVTPSLPGPTPNVGFGRADVDAGARASDPDGDIAYAVRCKTTEIKQVKNGRTVCVSPAEADPSRTFTNR